MLQNLLAERLKLSLHRVKQEFAVYELRVAKSGRKLRESTVQKPNLDRRPGGPLPPLDRNGFPQLPAGTWGSSGQMVNGVLRQTFQSYSIQELCASPLGKELGMRGEGTWTSGRVIDQTGLTARYDFTLEYVTTGAVGAALLPASHSTDTGPVGHDLFTALERQLGLKLAKGKALLDVLVVDRVEKVPVEN